MKQSKESLLDQRLVKRNIKEGRLSKKEYESFIANLLDQEGNFDDISKEVFESQKVNLQDAPSEED